MHDIDFEINPLGELFFILNVLKKILQFGELHTILFFGGQK
jgi:hypothetical protein